MLSLDTCIKEIGRCQQVGKVLYIKFTLSHKLRKYLDRKIQGYLSKRKSLTSYIQKPSCKVDELEEQVINVHINIRKMELEKELMVRILSKFIESIALNISAIERKLEESVKSKDTYANFTYSYLYIVEIASYALCAMLTTTKVENDIWEKGMNSLKENIDDCMNILRA